jgi:hypothetical protein
MQEEYLHYLWRMKRLNFNQLKLVNGSQSSVHIDEVGWYNLDAGPDFFNGMVTVDGIQWSGNIEIHIKSSDWYAHKHHLDTAYDNVVLHVVYEHDKEVYVNGVALPTIELKNLIDPKHHLNYTSIITKVQKVPCYNHVKDHEISLLQQIDISFIHRIERKGLDLLETIEGESRNKNALFLLAAFQSVGGRTNKLPMQELAQLITYAIVARERWENSRLEALLFGAAGFLNDDHSDEYYVKLNREWKVLKNKYQLSEMNKNSWKFGGIRPYSFPTYILAQLSGFLIQLDYAKLDQMSPEEIIVNVYALKNNCIHSYWESHFYFGKETKKRKVSFSNLFKDNLIINGIVPYLITLKHLTNDFAFADKAIDLMENLRPEKNTVINYWKNIGFQPKNALESQGLLELNNEFCNFKKCLSCKVGVEVLEKKL